MPQVDAPSLEHIYKVWFAEVVRWVRWLGGPDAEREDLAQDVFVIAQRRLSAFDGQNLAGWLYQITRNRVRDYRRLRWTRALRDRVEVSCGALDDVALGPAERLETKQVLLALERGLSRLTEPERVALLLLELEGYAGEEIAELQRVPLNTVWSRIRRGRAKLTKKFEGMRLPRQTPYRCSAVMSPGPG